MTATQRQQKTALATVKPPLLKIYGLQCTVLLVASGFTYSINGVVAKSLLIGGLISVLPNAYFARQVFKYAGAAYAREVNQSFYRAEAGKFIATVGLFAATFAMVRPLSAVAVFSAYLVGMLLNTLLVAVLRNPGAR